MSIPTGLYVNEDAQFIFIESNKRYLYSNLRYSNVLDSRVVDLVRIRFKRVLPKEFICYA